MQELVDLGFSNKDIFLFWTCPIAGAIGAFAHAIMIYLNFETMKKPAEISLKFNEQNLFEMVWVVYRLLLGAITGLLLSLYFLGALDDQASTIARIWGLAIALGYVAPKLWVSQEKLVVGLVDKKLKEYAGSLNNNEPRG